MNPIIVTVLVVVTLPTNGLARAVDSACRNVIPAGDLDGDWMDKVSEEGWDCPMGSKFEANLDVGGPEFPKDNKTLEHKRCYTTHMQTKLTSLALPSECRFNKSNQRSCIIKTQGTAAEALFKFYGDFYYTLTDNKNFVVAYGCLMKAKHFWVGCVPQGQTMKEELKGKILKHVREVFQMSTDPQDMKNESDPIKMDLTKGGSCAASQKKKKPIENADEAAGSVDAGSVGRSLGLGK